MSEVAYALGAPEGAGDFWSDLFDVSLTEADAIRLIGDTNAPADLFAEAARILLDRSGGMEDVPVRIEWLRFLADPRLASESAARKLLPYMLSLHPGTPLRIVGPSLQYLASLPWSDSLLEDLLAHVWSLGAQMRVRAAWMIEESLLAKAPDVAVDRDRLARGVSAVVWSAYEESGATPEFISLLAHLLDTPARFWSDSLADLALSIPALWKQGTEEGVVLLRHPKWIADGRLKRLDVEVRLRGSRFLFENPALADDQAREIYQAQLRKDARSAGRLLARRPSVMESEIESAPDLAWLGVGDLMVRATLPYQEGLARMIARRLASLPILVQDEDVRLADYLFEKLEDDALGAAFLTRASPRLAQRILFQLAPAPPKGKLLEAYLAHYSADVRKMLLPDEASVDLTTWPEERLDLYRTVILPRLIKDRSKTIRERATRMATRIADSEAQEQLVLEKGVLGELPGYVRGMPRISAAGFDILFQRAHRKQGGDAVLSSLAARGDLTADQYRRLLTTRLVRVYVEVAKSLPATLPGAAEIIQQIVAEGSPATVAALATRPEWDESMRVGFRRHADERVRCGYARSNPALTPEDVASLLSDSESRVRSALVSNPQWPRLLREYEERLRGD